MVEELFIQASCDLKHTHTHTPKTGVLLCCTKTVLSSLQVQDSWAIRRGKIDNVLACVEKKKKKSRRS